MSNQLLPCPFCQGPAEVVEGKRGWFSCADNECPAWHIQALAEDWNRRATQPAAGKPIGKVELFGINMTYVEWRDRKMPPLGTELYAAPPAAAHGDEAVRKDAERYRWLRNPGQDVALVLDKKTGHVPVDGRGFGGYGIYEYRAGTELDEAIDAAMRAQGDGEVL